MPDHYRSVDITGGICAPTANAFFRECCVFLIQKRIGFKYRLMDPHDATQQIAVRNFSILIQNAN